MEQLAKHIVDLIFEKLEPEIHWAMVEKIIDVALKNWTCAWQSDDKLNDLIDKAVDEARAVKYKVVIDYIADKKAREKLLKRAKQNGISETEIETLFEKVNNGQ